MWSQSTIYSCDIQPVNANELAALAFPHSCVHSLIVLLDTSANSGLYALFLCSQHFGERAAAAQRPAVRLHCGGGHAGGFKRSVDKQCPRAVAILCVISHSFVGSIR